MADMGPRFSGGSCQTGIHFNFLNLSFLFLFNQLLFVLQKLGLFLADSLGSFDLGSSSTPLISRNVRLQRRLVGLPRDLIPALIS
jgi:hypothetical protein